MEFKVLSHAGLLVQNQNHSLICDPWLVGSCYWRSWWNYPPVSEELIASLNPDFIYLTHIHWDHFQGPSLRRLGKDKTILVPKGNYDRIVRDLHNMGFHHVIELSHGKTFQINEKFKITSYQFGFFLDSALLIEVDNHVLLNLNDSKHMGGTLKQIIDNHPPVDFVFRSHSSANSRLCYEIINHPEMPVDDINSYIENFALTARATGAKYAIPFASNHCHLHPDVVRFNKLVQTPRLVEQYFKLQHIDSPEVKVMLSGDSFSSESGFHIDPYDWFENRDEKIQLYLKENNEKLEKQAEKETRVGVNIDQLKDFFRKFSSKITFVIKLAFKKNPIVWVLAQGDAKYYYEVNLYDGKVRVLTSINDFDNPIQVHTTAFLMRQCIAQLLFSHLPISKRVTYRATKNKVKYIKRMNLLFNLYEHDMLPLRRILTWRSIKAWSLRWREIWLYACLTKDLLFHKKLSFSKYLIDFKKQACEN